MARFVLLASTFLPCAWAYIAAVVQHVPPNSAADTPEAIMMANLDGYWNSTTTALRNGAQIIVFPEFGLFSGKFTSNCTAPTAKSGFCFDVPSTNSVFCGSNVVHPVLAKLSCMAAQAGSEAYVSVNICEATEDGNYNTQLVFGGKGQLVAKYRKSHPWMTSCYLKPEQPDLVTFPTSFAGTVGVFTCFDILFPSPGPVLASKGISTFVYSAAIPIVGSTVTTAWSWKYNATLIASQNAPGEGGIWRGGQRLTPKPSQSDEILYASL